MHEIATRCPALVALDIRGCWRITNAGVSAVSEYCKDLQVLHVAECRDVTEDALHKLRVRGVKVDRAADPLYARGLNLNMVNNGHGPVGMQV